MAPASSAALRESVRDFDRIKGELVVARSISQSAADIEAFAEKYGLTKLTHDHLARMQELAPVAAELGGKLPRPRRKSDLPAPRFNAMSINKV